MYQKLLTKEVLKKLPPLYSNDGKKPEDVKIIVKFFNPYGVGTWYITEYDPDEKLFFGVADLGMQENRELGYISQKELFGLKRFGRTMVERDMYFGFKHTLKEVLNREV